MPVCRFFLQGHCRFGDGCRYEHRRSLQPDYGNQGNYGNRGGTGSQYRWSSSGHGPQGDAGQQRTSGILGPAPGYGGRGYGSRQDDFRSDSRGGYVQDGRGRRHQTLRDSNNFQSGNRFAVLQDQRSQSNRSNQSNAAQSQDINAKDIIESIQIDVEEWQNGRMWLFTCYGPSKSKVCIPGLEDLSAEELRFLAYMAEKAKSFQEYTAAYAAAVDAVEHKRNQLKKPSHNMRNKLVDLYQGAVERNPYVASTAPSIFGTNVRSLEDFFGKRLANIRFPSEASPAMPDPQSALGVRPPATEGGIAPASGLGPDPRVFGLGSAGTFSRFGQQGSSSTHTVAQSILGPLTPTGAMDDGSLQKSNVGGAFGGGHQTGLPQTQPGSPGQQPKTQTKHTLMHDLSSEEKVQFEATMFILGKIPTRPPPIELLG